MNDTKKIANKTAKKKTTNKVKYNLWTALHKFQSLNLMCECKGRNTRFKGDDNPEGTPYPRLEDVIPCVNKGIEFGLFFTNHLITKESGEYLKTVIRHVDDTQTIESDHPLICINPKSAHSFGAAVTYAKRYNLMALYGIRSEISQDDDGNQASPKPPSRRQTVKEKQDDSASELDNTTNDFA